MHILRHLIPFHIEACAVGAENGIGGVLQICLRIIIYRLNDRLGVVAGELAVEPQLQLSPTLSIGGNLIGIVLQLRSRYQPG